MQKCFLVIILFFLISCDDFFDLEIMGNGRLQSAEVSLQSFNKIELTDDFVVEIYQSDAERLWLEADENLINYISYEVDNNLLLFGVKDNKALIPQKQILIKLYVVDIESIDISGAGQVTVYGLKSDKLNVAISGGSRFKVDSIDVGVFYYESNGSTKASVEGKLSSVVLRQVGSGEIDINGIGDNISIIQEGSGLVNTIHFSVQNADVNLVGSGLIYCNSESILNVTVDGLGKVFYTGNPIITKDLTDPSCLIHQN
ncbi:head GIN domain-containing protein [Geofilum sp. OHC36d9]|uniref:head GIN domain-containing protein n=1 Tax=Geofilum sp. OHC36d9 TaxID=3458413 RepID=UPI0040342F48